MKNTTTLKRKIAAGMIAAVAAVSAFAVTASADSTQAGAAPETAFTEQQPASKYKVYKNDMTVKMYGEEWTHDEFEAVWIAIYEGFGADVTIEMVKDYTNSPHSEEWIRTGGPVFFVDCWFQLNWYAKNDITDLCHKFEIGRGWWSPEGWR